MENTNNQPIRGGGTSLNVSKKVSLERAKMWKEPLKYRMFAWKDTTVRIYVLVEHFDWEVRRLAPELELHPTTVYKHYKDGRWWSKKNKFFREEVDLLRDYILYNAKYLP